MPIYNIVAYFEQNNAHRRGLDSWRWDVAFCMPRLSNSAEPQPHQKPTTSVRGTLQLHVPTSQDTGFHEYTTDSSNNGGRTYSYCTPRMSVTELIGSG